MPQQRFVQRQILIPTAPPQSTAGDANAVQTPLLSLRAALNSLSGKTSSGVLGSKPD